MFFHDANTAIFSKAEIKALAEFASKDTTRAHLNAVLVDFAKGSAVSTDGHRLAKSNSAACFADAPPCLIPLDAWERAGRLCRKASHGVLVKRDGDRVNLTAIDPGSFRLDMFGGPDGPEPEAMSRFALGSVEARCPDAQFPPYEQVIPNMGDQEAETYTDHSTGDPVVKPRTTVFGMNARYLGSLGLCAIAAGHARTEGVELHPGPGPLDPLLALCNGPDGAWTVVVMPMRI